MPAAIETTNRLLSALQDQAGVTLQAPEAEQVHDLRVAIRRLRQALDVFENELSTKETKALQKRLKKLISLAGEVRDCDIALKLLPKDGADTAKLRKKLQRQREEAASVLTGALAKWHAAGPAEAREISLEAAAERELAPSLKRFFSAGSEAAAKDSTGGDMHRFRLRAKKFRYTVELFRPVLGAAGEERLEQLKGIQTMLGDINDCRAGRALLTDLGAGDEIRDGLKRKQRRLAARFRRSWTEGFAAQGTERKWARSLRGGKPGKRHGRGNAGPPDSPHQ